MGTVPNAVLLEWKRFPGMTPNHEFIGQLQSVADPDATLLFMCRSGARSHDAAAAAAAEAMPSRTTCWKVLKAIKTPASIVAA